MKELILIRKLIEVTYDDGDLRIVALVKDIADLDEDEEMVIGFNIEDHPHFDVSIEDFVIETDQSFIKIDELDYTSLSVMIQYAILNGLRWKSL